MNAYLMDIFDGLYHEPLHQANSRKIFSAPHDSKKSFSLLLLHDQNKKGKVVKYKSHTPLEFQVIVPRNVLPLNIVDGIWGR